MSKHRLPTLLAGSSVYLAANALTAALGLLLLPVLTRHLSPDEYGVAAMFGTLVGLCTAVVGLNCAAVSARRHYDSLSSHDFAEYVGACVQVIAASGVVVLAAAVAFRTQISAWMGLELRWTAWAVLTSVFAVVVQLAQAQWRIRGAARSAALQQSAEAACATFSTLLLVVVLGLGAAGRIVATILTTVAFGLLAVVLLRRAGLIRMATWRPQHIADIVKYGVPLVPHVGAGFVLTAADRIVVTSELGIAQAGIYMVAAHLAQAVTLIFDAINKAYVPWLFDRLQSGDAHIQRLIVRYTYLWFAFLLGLGWLAFRIGPWIVTAVGGERYAAAGAAIGWLLLGQVFAGMYLTVTNYVFYAKRTGLLSFVTTASAALNILLLVMLTPVLGIRGAAMSFGVAMGVRFLATWWAAQRSHPMPWLGLGLLRGMDRVR